MTDYVITCDEETALWIGNDVDSMRLLVRCRDCAYSIHFFHHDDERYQCTEPYQEGDDVKPDAYCWRGKRKEGGECNGEPFVEYAARVAKSLYDEAFALLEGCDEPDFSAIDNICALCVDIAIVAKRWRKEGGDD